ncbi:MAG TPA: translation factor SUA5, partial [Ruminococcus sp.]|nr:translation factor SUA5 [Ruminococcus sp.]
DSSQQAHMLFARLRELDEIGAEKVYVRAPSAEGVGLAVYNRLIRAAGFEVIKL